jgi:magnesium transporter
MIHTVYYHGDDAPAQNLTIGQVRAALLDPAGTLWVDLAQPTEKELGSALLGAFGLDTQQVAACRDQERPPEVVVEGSRVFLALRAPSAVAGQREPPVTPDDRPCGDDSVQLALWLGTNYVVSCHREAISFVDELRTAVAADSGLLAEGADRLGAQLLDGMLDLTESVAGDLESDLRDTGQRVLEQPRQRDAGHLLRIRRRAGEVQLQLSSLTDTLELLTAGTPAVRSANRVYYLAAAARLRRVLERVHTLEQLTTDTIGVYSAIESSRARRALDRLSVVAAVLLVLLVFAWVVAPALVALGIETTVLLYVRVAALAVLIAIVAYLWRPERR